MNMDAKNTDIAVVGMSCRLPGAPDYETFWKNLEAGRSSITEVPSTRWDWEAYWGDPQTEKNKSNSKWGGFLEGVDNFDADFFGIAAKEVERMDPQQRIMLELTWACFEDAGIRPSEWSGKKVGVFLGVFNFDFKELQERSTHLAVEAHHSTGTATALIANRISYYFNFRGPSFPIDTACSSSLSAIHSSIQSLLQGECSLAVAGGINLLLTPTRHISFSKTGMLSPTGSCKSFDDSADGYVRGEGAGLLLLKPLDKALEDKDNIYGIIKGSAVNHGGKTYSLTYPNPEAQMQVIADAQQRAGVAPESISYIEAHGTGTPKGDPIEVQGLINAFLRESRKEDVAQRKGYCGLGTVKTNVGHLEAAAGVAGIIKVLLSMKYRQLPGLQNFRRLNQRISLEDSPFYLVTGLKEWEPLRDNDNNEIARRAGVSSFGFGGTNAHVVLEEAPAPALETGHTAPPYYLICISAKTADNLLRREKDLAAWLNEKHSHFAVADIARTLSRGREHFGKRTVLIVRSIEEMRDKLALPAGQSEVEGYFTNGSWGNKKEPIAQLFIETGKLVTAALDSGEQISNEEYYRKLAVLAELYLKGFDPDWDKPWFGSNGQRIGLPTYPFTNESHWLPELSAIPGDGYVKNILRPVVNATNEPTANSIPGVNSHGPLHALLGENISDFRGLKFSTRFTGEEFFLKDHVIKGRRVLPAVAYLEMVRAAIGELTKGAAQKNATLYLENIIWAQPILVDKDSVEVHTTLVTGEDGRVSFEISGGAGEPRLPGDPGDDERRAVLYSRGGVVFKEKAAPISLNIADLKESCQAGILGQEQCYRAFRDMGFEYGPAHRGIEVVYAGHRRTLAKLRLPAVASDTLNGYTLHPAMMDAALQACLLIDAPDGVTPGLYLPFALDHLEIAGPCTEDMWAVVGSAADGLHQAGQGALKRLNIDLCDKEGKICVRMKGFSFKLAASASAAPVGFGGAALNKSDSAEDVRKKQAEDVVLLLAPEWKERPVSAGPPFTPYKQRLVILCEPDNIGDRYLQEQLPDASFMTLQGAQENIGQRYQSYTRRIFEEIRAILKDRPMGKALVQIVVFEKEAASLFAGLSGLLRTAGLENPNFSGQLIRVSSGEGLAGKLQENALQDTNQQVRYAGGKRYVQGWKEIIDNDSNNVTPWKDNGVYLISGGTGGLGALFAKEIASGVKSPSLILLGRSPVDEHKNILIGELRSLGARAEYRQGDVSDKRSLAELINSIGKDYKDIHGIIHCAGIVRDNYIIKKTKEEAIEVLAPKVAGLTYLDELTREMPLDFFILFSSIVGALGNAGQADYAAANAYLDEYADWRNRLVARGERCGHTLAIDWPLWKDGGMRLGKEMEAAFLEQMKMSLLETGAGIRSLNRAMISGVSRVMVAPGAAGLLREKYLGGNTGDGTKYQEPGSGLSEKKVIGYFKEVLSAAIKRPAAQIEADAPMEEYGIDSVMVMQMTNELENVFGSLPKTLFFEYQNIQELAGYFIESHSEKLTKILGQEKIAETREIPGPGRIPDAVEIPVQGKTPDFAEISEPEKTTAANLSGSPGALDIAIIGVAGRYPQADNLREFWENLKMGKDCITEIPEGRWDYRPYFDQDKEKEGMSYSKWGGFINDVDKFDPLFFNISPLEAERMDPQERLFLQCVYETIEDAGYTRHSLGTQKQFELGKQVGVYVGVMYEEYQLFGAQEALHGRPVALWGLPSSIANRVSYYCDFHGPSMAIDTMCSSSLTAIHLACESIVRGNCELAIAGGVNVSVHPNKYLFLSQGRFASSKGRCESFGIGGDGYVPGEGVGAVLLKPLSRAIADGDNIYGVIRSTALNHGGKTNGYTVPNPRAQAGVIGKALKDAGINPRMMSYLEAHGTGTSLGDPIEIAGLSKAIHGYTKDTQFCAIGSAKSNIGHCESAAGIAGVTKVLLQMKYRQIVPSLHSETLNSNIDFSGSPFIVQQDLSDWKRPVLEVDGWLKEFPLCAGISSFGAGGANAHIIIEEYIPDHAGNGIKSPANDVNREDPAIILLSAIDEDRLKEQAKQLLTAIRDENKEFWKISEDLLADMAYTLQVGREHMKSRLALTVTSIDDLEAKLKDFISGIVAPLPEADDRDAEEMVGDWLREKKYDKITARWMKGRKVDWEALYRNLPGNKAARPWRRVSLPAYPFKKERYWVGEVSTGNGDLLPGRSGISFIHPLLHENTSDLMGQRFSVRLRGDEFFMKDHQVGGRKILPAVAHLEMAREAVRQFLRSFACSILDIRLQNMIWMQPVVVEEGGLQVDIELHEEEKGKISFEIYRSDPGNLAEREIFSQGSATVHGYTGIKTTDGAIVPGIGGASMPGIGDAGIKGIGEAGIEGIGVVGIKALEKECGGKVVFKAACYEAFLKMGFQYGPAHQGLEQVFIGDNKILARVALPSLSLDMQDRLVLHPGLMDPALQACLLWNWTDGGKHEMLLPVAVEAVEVYAETPATAWVVISNAASDDDLHKGAATFDRERVLDIDILTEKGEVCVRLKGMLFKAPSLTGMFAETSYRERPSETLLLFPAWERKEINQGFTDRSFDKHLIIMCGQYGKVAGLSDAEIIVFGKGKGDDFGTVALQIFEKVRALLTGKEKGNILVQVIIPAIGEGSLYGGITGLLKTAQKENPRFFGQVIHIAGEEDPGVLVKKIRENSLSASDNEIRYESGSREVLRWRVVEDMVVAADARSSAVDPRSSGADQKSSVADLRSPVARPWKDGGVYLITGGTGGLGFIFASEIARNATGVKLILTGRSLLDSAKESKLAMLRELGAEAEYQQVDITDRESVQQLIRSIQEGAGSLSGIIHSAGVVKDNFLIRKTNLEWSEVLAPKVSGIQWLDLATRDIPMDIFIFFSSVTGAVGNAGQADYATANAFMDEYAGYRNALVAKGLRHGHTLSVNWPLWQEGGMHVDKEAEKYLFETMGMTPLPTKAGLEAFYRAWLSKKSRVMVAEGDRERIYEKIISAAASVNEADSRKEAASLKETGEALPSANNPGNYVPEEVIHYFSKLLSSVIKLPVEKIRHDVSMEEYGIDSVMVMKMTGKLEKVFGSLSKTLFFEYQTVRELARYFMEEHHPQLAVVAGIMGKREAAPMEAAGREAARVEPGENAGDRPAAMGNAAPRLTAAGNEMGAMKKEIAPVQERDDIAIVGLAGRYPQADNLEQFWENLCQGKDCITEIPKDRWDHRLYFDADKNKAGKSYSKWGGFLNGVDEFDPLFFNISPREAELLDPQERLFLQCAYETMEDAGYSRQTLAADDANGLAGNVGVYVGVMYEEYQLFGAEETMKGRNIALFGNPSSIANRVSYFYNFNGPSMAVDTMCSSSLTAIHLACQGIFNGDCKAAIAGGVNISIHPNKYLLLAQGKFISGKGRCESFGIGGDGYVPGEGVGAVLLKPLSMAIADGDHIYGVIRGTSLNHGGKTNGYTVPNPNAQAKVIKKAFERSGIDARTISYLEAHGTGTSLGDPIEITGLTKAFREYTKDDHFCAIGSVKSNIGHGESAAGIAGITKILLQLQHKQLAPSLHAEELNPNIDFTNSPFVVQQTFSEWRRPLIRHDGQDREILRRAGISSFGAGGSNAHLIIEEFDGSRVQDKTLVPSDGVNEPVIILLSAKNTARLKESAERLFKALHHGRYKDDDLPDIAFTLQTGRDAHEERLAIIVRSIGDLCGKLEAFLKDDQETDGLYQGRVRHDDGTIEAFAADEELQEAVVKWAGRRKYARLCSFWVKGMSINWSAFYKRQILNSRAPKRVSLPSYPFARERCWISRTDEANGIAPNVGRGATNIERPIPNIDKRVPDRQAPEEDFSMLTFQEEWFEQPIEVAVAEAARSATAENASGSGFAAASQHRSSIRRLVCFLSDQSRQKAMLNAIGEISKDTEVLFISRQDAGKDLELLPEIIERHGKVDAFIYLWALEGETGVEDLSPIVNLIKAIGAGKWKNSKILLAGRWGNTIDRCHQESWIGFVRSAGLVLPDTRLSVIYHQEGGDGVIELSGRVRQIWDELQLEENHEALYREGKRYVYQVRKCELPTGSSLIKQNGTYLITGGLGGLGLIFARHLAEKFHAGLILTGRSSLSPEKQQFIDELKSYGSKIIYLQGDVCNENDMKEGLAAIRKEMGSIDGLIHAAGTEEEGTILDRSPERFRSVLSSKIQGTILLDELLKEEPLDFVCYFSSSAAVLGDFGSCDYAIGNRFQMAFARYRAQMQSRGLRSGRTIAINWPLWKDGGMNLRQEDSAKMYLGSSGQRYLERQEGIELFEQLLVSDMPLHMLVIVGKEQKVSKFLGLRGATPEEQVPPHRADELTGWNTGYGKSGSADNGKNRSADNNSELGESLESDICRYVSELLKIPGDQLDIYANLADLGFDSVTLTQLAASLSKHLDFDIVPALFFSYSTIEKLSRYLVREHYEGIARIYEAPDQAPPTASHQVPLAEPHQASAADLHQSPPVSPVIDRDAVSPKTDESQNRDFYEPIAVIGMSGRFPQARNIEEMWKILAEGRDAVSEIPGDRFDWRLFYGGEHIEEGKTNCKWTGLIPGISEFDPLFFEISPSEANLMDPRQRLLLQEGWKALEDAGYGKENLENNKVALYVGVEEGDYAELTKQADSVTSNHNAILAARLSYFLNLSGPNMAINTACSSGLVAAHQAFLSLQNRECDMAIAAGVNLMITPGPYVTMSQAGMLSGDGTCYTFDKRANGMVPGEAVAVLVFKRLSRAISDGDPIYATITGSGINYDGKTNGITAPGGLSQKELILSVYDRYRVNPENIGHIVTHGTGTRLGDPVEINALYDAFRGHTDKEDYCALTSVKTNFGHTFAASGLVSLISLIQGLRHEAIPASLHCEQESDYIIRQKSPFFINKSLKAWPAIPGKTRTGGVSAFGMSGTNAHMVVQSYDAKKKDSRFNDLPYYLLPLSAKTSEALEEKIRDMIPVLQSRECPAMAELSYTLMTGRHHFSYRCAIVTSDRSDAARILSSASKNEQTGDLVWGEVARGFKADGKMKEYIADPEVLTNDPGQLKEDLFEMAGLYCQGYDIPWESLFPGQKPDRVHLPTYPFSAKRYWASQKEQHVASTQWLFTREEWTASPFQKDMDLNSSLSRCVGKRICVVFSNEEEKDGLLNLLDRLGKAANIPERLAVTSLHTRDVHAETMKEISPDTVLVLGPSATSLPGEADISTVLQLTRSLMQTAWDEPIRLYYIYHSSPDMPNLGSEALSGFFHSAMKENDKHVWKSIRSDNGNDSMIMHQLLLKEWLADECSCPAAGKFLEVRYEEGQRSVKELVETGPALAAFVDTLAASAGGPAAPLFRQGGNYIVAGGMGYIGSSLLQILAKKYRANLAVIARGAKEGARKEQCEKLEQQGARVYYFAGDISDLDALELIYNRIKQELGEIHGVINLARVHESKSIMAKTGESFSRVSDIKIKGTFNLDRLTKNDKLDIFLSFASIGAYGARGDSDYAYSVAYQNAFSRYRNQLTKKGERSGMAVSFCWGPWEEDKLFPESRRKMQSLGFDLINMGAAWPLIEAARSYEDPVIGICAVNDKAKIKAYLGMKEQPAEVKDGPVAPDVIMGNPLETMIGKWEREKLKGRSIDIIEIRGAISVEEMENMDTSMVERIYGLCFENGAGSANGHKVSSNEQNGSSNGHRASSNGQNGLSNGHAVSSNGHKTEGAGQVIRDLVMQVLQIEALDNEKPLQDYGLDSIMAMRLSTRLEKKLNREVKPHLLIEFPTVKALAKYLS